MFGLFSDVDKLTGQPGDQNLQCADEEPDHGPDDLHEPEFFGHDLVKDLFQFVGGEGGDLLDDDMLQVEFGFQVCGILLHDLWEEGFDLVHEGRFHLTDRLIPNEHTDHGHFIA